MSQIKEALTSSQAFWLVGSTAAGTALVMAIATGQIPALANSAIGQAGAAWAAAIATFSAVRVALSLSDKEHKRTLDLRAEDDAAKQRLLNDRAAVLAYVFCRELSDAADDLRRIADNTTPLNISTNFDDVKRYMLRTKRDTPRLVMMQRFADTLECFRPETAAAILMAISEYESVSSALPKAYEGVIDPAVIRRLANARHTAANKASDELIDLQAELTPYYQGKIQRSDIRKLQKE